MAEQQVEEPLDDLSLISEEAYKKEYGAYELNPNEEVDNTILKEMARINTWAGISGKVVYQTVKGTHANSSGIIGINKSEIYAFYGKFTPEAYSIALLMVLAHEAGHLCQWKYLAPALTKPGNRLYIEAHADIIAGAWLGRRLAQGKLDGLEAATDAMLQLTGGNYQNGYPPEVKRKELMEKGRSVLPAIALRSLGMEGVGSDLATQNLTAQDIKDLYDTAKDMITPNR